MTETAGSRPSVERAFDAFQNTSASLPLRDRLRAVLALFEPETVTTAAELDALPVGSVVLDPFAAVCTRVTTGMEPFDWRRVTTAVKGGEHRHAPYLPATVLHRGGAEAGHRGAKHYISRDRLVTVLSVAALPGPSRLSDQQVQELANILSTMPADKERP